MATPRPRRGYSVETSRGDATAGPRATPWPDHGSSIGTDARLRYGGKPSAGVQKESTCERFLLFVRTKKGRRESSGSSEGASEDDAPPPPPPGRPPKPARVTLVASAHNVGLNVGGRPDGCLADVFWETVPNLLTD